MGKDEDAEQEVKVQGQGDRLSSQDRAGTRVRRNRLPSLVSCTGFLLGRWPVPL